MLNETFQDVRQFSTRIGGVAPESVPSEGLSSFLRVTPQGASLPKVIGRLVIRPQKDCQEIGPFNRFADSGFPAGGLGFQITWIPSMPFSHISSKREVRPKRNAA